MVAKRMTICTDCREIIQIGTEIEGNPEKDEVRHAGECPLASETTETHEDIPGANGLCPKCGTWCHGDCES